MTEYLGKLLTTSEDISATLKKRRSPVIYQSVAHPMISGMEETGWTITKKNKTTAKMQKPKPSAEKLEDEVWSLVARMGFKELSQDRSFTIHVGDSLNPRQIDVFAKDDETALLIECTGCEHPTKKGMSNLIEKISSIKPQIQNSINKHYGKNKKLKVRWAIATRNIVWGDADLAKAEAAKILVLRDQEITYYNQLTSQLGTGARYQFLANIFKLEDIHELKLEVPATRGKMGGSVFYNFLISPAQLLKIAYVSHKASRDAEALNTYQRMLQSKRLKKIAEYVDKGGRFPTNIVVNVETKSRMRFDLKENIGDAAFGTLYLPNKYASAWIIDGQHRLYGYALSKFAETSNVPVLAFENLSAPDQAKLFIDINHEQVRVSKNLLIDLFSDLKWDSPNLSDQMYALSSKTVKILETSPLSPVFGRIIITGKDKSAVRCLTLTALADAIRKINLYGEIKTGDILKHGPLYKKNNNLSLKKGAEFLSGYFDLFAKSNPDNWLLGDAPGGYLCTNNAVVAQLRVLKNVCDYLDKNSTLACYELDADELLEKVKKIITPLLTYLQNAPPDDLRALRNQVGDKGQRNQAMAMMVFIREKFADFDPQGLQEYVDSYDKDGARDGRDLIDKIQMQLHNGVIAKLKSKYPNGKETWWAEGVPVTVRTDCAAKREADPERLDLHQQLVLIHYKSIAAQNWELFKEDFSFKDKGNKEAQLGWLVELNKIRNKISHPERGMISKAELAYLRDIATKIASKFQAVSDAA